jgi:hypothetical protein
MLPTLNNYTMNNKQCCKVFNFIKTLIMRHVDVYINYKQQL